MHHEVFSTIRVELAAWRGSRGKTLAGSAARSAHAILCRTRAALARTGLRADEIAAHEVGHTLGLPHSTSEGNLMRPINDYGDCRPVLTEKQIAGVASPEAYAATRTSSALANVSRRALVDHFLSRALGVLHRK